MKKKPNQNKALVAQDRLEADKRERDLLDPNDFWQEFENPTSPVPEPDKLPVKEPGSESQSGLQTIDVEGMDGQVLNLKETKPLDPSMLAPALRTFRPIAKIVEKHHENKQRSEHKKNVSRTPKIFMSLFWMSLFGVLSVFLMWYLLYGHRSVRNEKSVFIPVQAQTTDPGKKPFENFDDPALDIRPDDVQDFSEPISSRSNRGSLHLRSNPPGAIVFINGQRRGVTPTEVRNIRTGGKVEIIMELDGFRSWRHDFHFDGNTLQREFIADMVKEVKCGYGTGWLHIDSSPSGATVELDGLKIVGKTPMVVSDICAETPHELRVMALGYRTWWRSFKLQSGQVLTYRALLER